MKDEMLKGYIIEGLNEIKRVALGGETQFIIREADELIEEIQK